MHQLLPVNCTNSRSLHLLRAAFQQSLHASHRLELQLWKGVATLSLSSDGKRSMSHLR